jgi:hypothetical protein
MIEIDEAPRGLTRLIYTSRSTETNAADLVDSVRVILVKSIHNNRMADITGFLVFGGDRFLQLLEGPTGEVDRTFERISQDSRHGDIAVIDKAPAERRMFRDWNMAQHQVTAADQALLAQAGLATFTPDVLDETGAIKIMTVFGGRYLR